MNSIRRPDVLDYISTMVSNNFSIFDASRKRDSAMNGRWEREEASYLLLPCAENTRRLESLRLYSGNFTFNNLAHSDCQA
jgi:hypothetical protein